MLDRCSPLDTATPFKSASLRIIEVQDIAITQIAGAEKDVKKVLGRVPSKVGVALVSGKQTIFKVSPTQYWLLNGEVAPTAGCYLTPLSSGRTVIAVEGDPARDLLSKCVPLDFHPSEFKPGTFTMTGIHHTPVLIHCVDENRFELYVLRTFALNIWEWLCDAGLEYAT
jgi:methylglutamate dehydrogenase subunit D